jgi:hypothetical protein
MMSCPSPRIRSPEMSFDLQSESGEEFSFSNSGWTYLLEFAAMNGFGWPVEANGDDKESLSAGEAAAMADAVISGIGAALPTDVAERVSEQLTQRLVTPSKSALFREDPLRIDAKTIEYWKSFAAFARRGGFTASF